VVLGKQYLEQLVALERVLEKASLMLETELKMELVMFPRASRMLGSGSHRMSDCSAHGCQVEMSFKFS